MELPQGYHILRSDILKSHRLLDFPRIGILSWLERILHRTLEPYTDFTVIGLEELFENVSDRIQMSLYLKRILLDSSNFLVYCSSIFLFPIKGSLEVWGQPIIRTRSGTAIELVPIFGNLQQLDVLWFHQQLNVQS